MARQSIFGDKRDEIKTWLERKSREAQAEKRGLHLNDLQRAVRDRYPDMLKSKSDDSVTQALYRILTEHGIWFGYHGRQTKAQASRSKRK